MNQSTNQGIIEIKELITRLIAQRWLRQQQVSISTTITTMQSRTIAQSRCSRSRSSRQIQQTFSSTTPSDQEVSQLLVQAKERELRLRHYSAEADRDLPKLIKRLRGFRRSDC